MISCPEGRTFCCEGIDRPVVLVPYSVLAVVKSVEEICIVDVKLVGADTDDRACSAEYESRCCQIESQFHLTVLFVQLCYFEGILPCLV